MADMTKAGEVIIDVLIAAEGPAMWVKNYSAGIASFFVYRVPPVQFRHEYHPHIVSQFIEIHLAAGIIKPEVKQPDKKLPKLLLIWGKGHGMIFC